MGIECDEAKVGTWDLQLMKLMFENTVIKKLQSRIYPPKSVHRLTCEYIHVADQFILSGSLDTINSEVAF